MQALPFKRLAYIIVSSCFVGMGAYGQGATVSPNPQPVGQRNFQVKTYDTKMQFRKAAEFFEQGAYLQALNELDKVIFTDEKQQALLQYWRGRCLHNIHRYSEAAEALETAKTIGVEFEDIHYILGQSLYATQELRKARKHFEDSLNINYKRNISLYYIGFISQILEEYKTARESYEMVMRAGADPEDVKPAVLYQYAELHRTRAFRIKKKSRRLAFLKERIVPLYEDVVDYDEDAAAAIQARKRIQEITGVDHRHVEVMRNGVPIPRKRYRAEITQDAGFDTNVTTEGDDSSVTGTNKSSFFTKTSVFARYQVNARKTWSFLPEVNTFYKRHYNRISNVIENDEFSVAPSIDMRFEHWLGSKPGTFTFSIEYERSWKDNEAEGSLTFNESNTVISLSERSTILGGGSSTLSAGLTITDSISVGSDASSPFVSFAHNFAIFGTYRLNMLYKAEFFRFDTETLDSDDYTMRFNINMTDLFYKTDVNPALLLTIRDTKRQSSARGTEILMNPSLTVVRHLARWLDGQIVLSYARQLSNDTTSHQYTQFTSTLGFTAKM